MQSVTSATAVATTARANDITLFASLELSKLKWVVTINSPGSEKFSKHGASWAGRRLPARPSSRSRAKAEQRYGVRVKTVVIQEAELDGFHRLLVANGIESHVVDAASIAVARRHRRAKTDSIDGETLLRTPMAWARGERRSVRRRARRRGSPAPDARARRAAQGTHSAYQSDPGRRPRRLGLQSASARSFRTARGAANRRRPSAAADDDTDDRRSGDDNVRSCCCRPRPRRRCPRPRRPGHRRQRLQPRPRPFR